MNINVFIATIYNKKHNQFATAYTGFKDKELFIEENDILDTSNNLSAICVTITKAIEKINNDNNYKINFFLDNEIAIKILNKQIKPKADENQKHIDTINGYSNVFFHLIRIQDNEKTIRLAKEVFSNSKNLICEKLFFGSINCLKVQLSINLEIYFHIGLKEANKWIWNKVKMSENEIGEIIHILKKDEGKASFFHKYENNNTQIWCNKSDDKFTIKINKISKSLAKGEFEVLRITLETFIARSIENF